VLNKLRKNRRPVFITRYGQPEAVLLSMERYKAMLDLLEDREDELDTMLGKRIHEERQAYQ
jgi:PHD/YefM family antitoxin component YafN of YafNO toxin-antitoxin module